MEQKEWEETRNNYKTRIRKRKLLVYTSVGHNFDIMTNTKKQHCFSKACHCINLLVLFPQLQKTNHKFRIPKKNYHINAKLEKFHYFNIRSVVHEWEKLVRFFEGVILYFTDSVIIHQLHCAISTNSSNLNHKFIAKFVMIKYQH